ncbi:MAG: hypothetical protein ACKVIX_05780 [Sphingomonadales bacterium]|jgi:hypothetical protein
MILTLFYSDGGSSLVFEIINVFGKTPSDIATNSLLGLGHRNLAAE